jgi:hypothetical protein
MRLHEHYNEVTESLLRYYRELQQFTPVTTSYMHYMVLHRLQ